MVTRILLALLGVFALVCVPSRAGDKADFVATAAKRLAAFSDGFDLEHKPGAVEALETFRAAAQRWSVDYLNTHPNAQASTIEAAAPMIEGDKAFVVEPLAPELFAISARYNEIGNVFLVGKQQNRFAVLWDVRTSDLADGWRAEDTLSDAKLIRRAMTGVVQRLPPDTTGHVRFYLEAVYAQPAGATRGGQLSFWRWNGTVATPLLVKKYAFNDDEPVQAEGDLVTLRSKTLFKTLAAYGCCDGRQMTWTFRVGPNDVRDLGDKPVIPELDAVDAMLDQLWNGKTAAEVASPTVIAALAPIVGDAKRFARQRGLTRDEQVGMLRDAAAWRGPNESQLCLVLDQWKGPKTADVVRRLVFTVPRGGTYLKNLTVTPGDDNIGCQGFAGKAP